MSISQDKESSFPSSDSVIFGLPFLLVLVSGAAAEIISSMDALETSERVPMEMVEFALISMRGFGYGVTIGTFSGLTGASAMPMAATELTEFT